CITPEILNEQIEHIEQIQNKNQLSNKLTDLMDIFNNFSLELEDKYVDGEDQLQMLADQLKDAPSMQQAHVYIDVFYRFITKELIIIESYLKTVNKVTIALYVNYENLNELDELDLFQQTTETYQKLKALAKEIEVVEEEPVLLSNEFSNLKNNPALLHLETHFESHPTRQYNSNEI